MSISITIGGVCFRQSKTPKAWQNFALSAYEKFISDTGDVTVNISAESQAELTSFVADGANVQCQKAFPFMEAFELAVGLKARLTTEPSPNIFCAYRKSLEPKMAFENVLRVYLAHYLPCSGTGLMLHGSCGIFEDKGIIFTGVSGAGKTTLSDDFDKTDYL